MRFVLVVFLLFGTATAQDLHALARAGSLTKVRAVIAAGADPRGMNATGQTARDVAHQAGDRDMVRLLRAAELLYEVAGPTGLREISTVRTEAGFFASALVGPEDLVLVRDAPDGVQVLFRLQEHAGLVAHLKALGLPGRWVLGRHALVDPNEDGVPDVFFVGACECHGSVIHAMVNGASGAALSVDSYPYPSADGEIVRHAYAFPTGAPGAMQRFLQAALAVERFASSQGDADVIRQVRSTEP
jgi:hypothetical protein